MCSELDPRRGDLSEQQIVLLHNRRASLRAEASGSPQSLLTPARPADWRWQYEGTTGATSAAIDHPEAEQVRVRVRVSLSLSLSLSLTLAPTLTSSSSSSSSRCSNGALSCPRVPPPVPPAPSARVAVPYR